MNREQLLNEHAAAWDNFTRIKGEYLENGGSEEEIRTHQPAVEALAAYHKLDFELRGHDD